MILMPLRFLSRTITFGLLCSLMTTACQRPPKKMDTLLNSASTLKSLKQLSYFRVSGKVGFRQGETGGQAKFFWQQTGPDFTLQLLNPFGGEEARLAFNKRQYSLKLPNQPLQYSTSIESLFKERLGWSAPVAHLSYWMRGIPLPQLPNQIRYNAEGARVMTQDGWTITYTVVDRVGDLPLPQAMILEHPNLSGGAARLKMVLHWSLD